jgi:hypothetical protein
MVELWQIEDGQMADRFLNEQKAINDAHTFNFAMHRRIFRMSHLHAENLVDVNFLCGHKGACVYTEGGQTTKAKVLRCVTYDIRT